jgi:hypothetical protein
VLATGFVASQYYLNAVNNLVAECRNKNSTIKPTDAPAWEKSTLVCELHELESSATRSSDGLVGVQAKIVENHHLGEAWLNRAYEFSAILVCIFGIPYAWFFLLRRIRELSDAVINK